MAVNLSLSPGQALVKQRFQRALDAEIPLFDIPEHRSDLLSRSRRVNLTARNYRRPHRRLLLRRHRKEDHRSLPFYQGLVA
ncbi:hypothetical protein D3C76_1080840 [compost metagenome]